MLKKVMYKAFLLLIMVTSFSFYYSLNVYAQTKIDNYKLIRTFEKDTTGDKISDRVNVLADVENESYIVEIKQHGGKNYILKPASRFKYLAPYKSFWNLNIQILDINNDNIPEIIIWSAMTHENIIHIFRWNGKEYKIVYSGFNTGFDFKDITGDLVLELVIDDRIYGTGDELTYFQWHKNQYQKIYYEIVANRTFEKIQSFLDLYRVLHANEFSYSNNYFEGYLNDYFTQEWINNENNIAFVKEFGKDLLSIQITKYLNHKLEFDTSTDKPIKVTWKLKVLAFKTENTTVIPKEMIMTVITKFVGNDEYKIDYINFSDSDKAVISTHSVKDYIKDSFYQSVNYNPVKGLLSFTIPKTVPEGYRFYLHVSGRMYMGNKSEGMSFHAFDEESENYSWEKGKTYTYSLNSESLDESLLVFGFVDKNNQEILYAIHISHDGTKSIESTD